MEGKAMRVAEGSALCPFRGDDEIAFCTKLCAWAMAAEDGESRGWVCAVAAIAGSSSATGRTLLSAPVIEEL